MLELVCICIAPKQIHAASIWLSKELHLKADTIIFVPVLEKLPCMCAFASQCYLLPSAE